MAILVEKQGDKVKITLDNGHAAALAKVMSDYNIVDEEKTLGFILTVMRDAGGKPVQTAGGSFVPSETIKKGATTTEEDAVKQ